MNTDTTSTRWPLLIHDQARLEYTRLLWQRARARERLLRHWTDARHPYAERFSKQYRALVERVLTSKEEADDVLDRDLRKEGQSLRVIVREIPPVFGSFY